MAFTVAFFSVAAIMSAKPAPVFAFGDLRPMMPLGGAQLAIWPEDAQSSVDNIGTIWRFVGRHAIGRVQRLLLGGSDAIGGPAGVPPGLYTAGTGINGGSRRRWNSTTHTARCFRAKCGGEFSKFSWNDPTLCL